MPLQNEKNNAFPPDPRMPRGSPADALRNTKSGCPLPPTIPPPPYLTPTSKHGSGPGACVCVCVCVHARVHLSG